MTSQADRLLRDAVARELFVGRMLKGDPDPNKPMNATWVAQDALRDADAFILAHDDHDKIVNAKPAASGEVKATIKRAGLPVEDDDDLA